jgi:hypothetical protein
MVERMRRVPVRLPPMPRMWRTFGYLTAVGGMIVTLLSLYVCIVWGASRGAAQLVDGLLFLSVGIATVWSHRTSKTEARTISVSKFSLIAGLPTLALGLMTVRYGISLVGTPGPHHGAATLELVFGAAYVTLGAAALWMGWQSHIQHRSRTAE